MTTIMTSNSTRARQIPAKLTSNKNKTGNLKAVLINSGVIGVFCLQLVMVSQAQSTRSLQQQAAAAKTLTAGQGQQRDTLLIADPTIYSDYSFPEAAAQLATEGSGINGSLQKTKPRYYLYGTSGDKTVSAGFKGYMSEDLRHWSRITKNGDDSYLVLDSAHNFGNKGFWAPQVLSLGGNSPLIMAYTANEQIAIASSAVGPQGPFVQKQPVPLFKDGFKHIDPFIFRDSASNKTYIYYVKLDGGNKIFVAELQISGDPTDDIDADKKTATFQVAAGSEKKCIDATADWENTAASAWPVTEGPTVLYHNGYYYLFYSANDFRNPDYAVGYATAKTPTGPWVKSRESPIITGKKTNLSGTGHGDVFQDAAGRFYYVFHAHHDKSAVAPRKTYLVPLIFQKDGSKTEKSRQGPDKILVDYKSVRPLTLTE